MSLSARVRGRREAGAGRGVCPSSAALAFVVLVGASFAPAAAGAALSTAARLQFRDAARAYDAGRMPDAARLYEGLVRGGHATTEVYFNLGNALAKDGRLGQAVLNYRKAWRLAPRDPDVAANLHLALQAAGASEADLSGAEIVFTRLSQREWAVAGVAAWWTTCLLLSLAILSRVRRWLFLRAVPLTALVVVAALLGLWTWRGFERAPELVVLSETQNALRAPVASAPPHFPLPEGSVVRAREHQGEWVRVSYGQRSGWIRRAACAPVLLEGPAR